MEQQAECQMRKLCIVILALALLLPGIEFSYSSAPVYKSITGCVIDGTLYSLQEGNTAAGKREIIVYPMKVNGPRLDKYEGQKVRLNGYLLPGDRFDADPKSLKIIGPCDRKSRDAIRPQSAR
jgi:hypothetical protein